MPDGQTSRARPKPVDPEVLAAAVEALAGASGATANPLPSNKEEMALEAFDNTQDALEASLDAQREEEGQAPLAVEKELLTTEELGLEPVGRAEIPAIVSRFGIGDDSQINRQDQLISLANRLAGLEPGEDAFKKDTTEIIGTIMQGLGPLLVAANPLLGLGIKKSGEGLIQASDSFQRREERNKLLNTTLEGILGQDQSVLERFLQGEVQQDQARTQAAFQEYLEKNSTRRLILKDFLDYQSALGLAGQGAQNQKDIELLKAKIVTKLRKANFREEIFGAEIKDELLGNREFRDFQNEMVKLNAEHNFRLAEQDKHAGYLQTLEGLKARNDAVGDPQLYADLVKVNAPAYQSLMESWAKGLVEDGEDVTEGDVHVMAVAVASAMSRDPAEGATSVPGPGALPGVANIPASRVMDPGTATKIAEQIISDLKAKGRILPKGDLTPKTETTKRLTPKQQEARETLGDTSFPGLSPAAQSIVDQIFNAPANPETVERNTRARERLGVPERARRDR